MSWGLVAVAGTALVGAGINYFGQQAASKTQADSAANAQQQEAQQYAQTRQDLSPYNQTGQQALGVAGNISGANGNAAQQGAVDNIQNGAIYQGMQAQGNKSILQGQSATGGLRTGSTQDILAQYSPQLLNQLINQQFSQNYQLAGLGENAAAMSGNIGTNSANAQADSLQNQGAAVAGGQLAGADALANGTQIIGLTLGQLLNQGNNQGGSSASLMSPGQVPGMSNTGDPGMTSGGSGQGDLTYLTRMGW